MMRTKSWLAFASCFAMATAAQAQVPAQPEANVDQQVDQGPIQQNQAEEGGPDIVVTGSFIRGTPEDAALPVDVISSDEIARQGSPTLVELVKALPSSAGVVGDSNQFGSSQSTGTGNVNLRGLGPTRTLVLLNGRRMAPAPAINIGVDTNLLPTVAIGRIEVLKDGAAALYGSDAIAGVVNFITRTDLEGIEATANYSFIDGSDGDYNFGLNFGTKLGDRGDLLLSAAYRHRSELSTLDRDWAIRPYFDNPQGGWSVFGSPGTYTPIYPNLGAPGGPVYSPAGVFADPGCNAISGPVVPNATGTPQCIFQYSRFDNLVEDEDHFQFFGAANYEITDNVELHLEGLYSGHEVPRENSSPSYSPVQFPTAALNGTPFPLRLPSPSFYIPNTNPGLIDLLANNPGLSGAGAAGAYGVTTTLLWRPLGVGGNPLTGEGKEDKRRFEAYRVSGGLNWDISESMNLDLAGTYMENWSDIATPDVVVSRLQLGLRGLGGFNCDPVAGTPGQGGCLWFNPFSNAVAGNITDGRDNPNYNPAVANSREVIDWMFEDYAYRVRSKLLVADLVLSGQTGIDLGGGQIGFAIGGQFRRDSASREVSPLADVAQFPCVDSDFNGNETCPGRTNGVFSFFGPLDNYSFDRDVKAVFAEIQVPFTDSLSLQAAVRYEDYGGSIGGTTNPKAALRWQVTDWLALRGSVSTTFRAPPQVQTIETPTTALSFTSAVGGYRAYDTFGNPALAPETADTYNAGIILQTGGFNATVDYWRFDFEGPIDNEPGGDMVSALFPTGVSDADACAAAVANVDFFNRFTFNGSCSRANLLRTRLNYVNSPHVRTSGIDWSANLRFDVGEGQALLGVDGTYVIEYKADDFVVEGVLVTPGNDYAGKMDYQGYGSIPDIKGQAYAQLGYGPHLLRATVRYIGEMEDTRGSTTFTETSPNGKTIGSFTTVDLNYTLEVEPSGTTLYVSVTNLLDEDPPFARLDLNYDPFTGNPLGRVYKVGVKQEF